ncbi:MAG: B12-binding domain-containing radical SAM protein [Nitrospinae bacterium]|nr:B12-binding domain-containing radical SAM protein [Nitrospinota bacterium]
MGTPQLISLKKGKRVTQKTIGKVLLFRSPLVYHAHVEYEDPHPPLELLYLGAALKPDYDVKILDGQRRVGTPQDFGTQKRIGISDKEILREASEFTPDLIGFSIMWHHQVPAARYFAELFKNQFPDVPIVAGGIAPSSSPDLLLESPYVDFTLSGDGEWALSKLCRVVTSGGLLSEVPGLAYRDGDTIVSTDKENIKELDDIPYPAYDLIDLMDYDNGYRRGYHKAYPMSGILPSRGCPLACHFCSLPAVSNRLFRTHSVERVIEDLVRMRDGYGIREVHFYDDNVINNRRFSKKLFKAMIDQNVGLHWLPEAGFALWKIDKEVLELAKASGMHRLDLPIETASDRVKDSIMDKGLFQNHRVVEIIRMAREVGVDNIHGYVIVGSPGETLEDMKETLSFVNALDLDYRGIRYGQPFPGTQFFDICTNNGFLAADFSLDRLWFSIPNIETPEFKIHEINALVAADRAVAMIRQGKVCRTEALQEIQTKHGTDIAQSAESLILELQEKFTAQEREKQPGSAGT